MANKSWKAFERRLAKRVGGKRIPVTGERDGADVVAGPFCYQAEIEARQWPSYLGEMVARYCGGGRALRNHRRCRVEGSERKG